jgi:hypothetical protein
MKICNICQKEFTLWERLTNKDDKHFLECEEKMRVKRINDEYLKSFREHSKWVPPKYFDPPVRRITPQRTTYTEPVSTVVSQDTGSDFLTGVIVGGVAGALVSDWLDSPSEPKFEGSGGTFGGGGATGSWEESTFTNESHNSSDDSNTSSYDSSDSSSSCDSSSSSSD